MNVELDKLLYFFKENGGARDRETTVIDLSMNIIDLSMNLDDDDKLIDYIIIPIYLYEYV